MPANTIGRAAGILLKDNKVLLMWRHNKGSTYYVIPGGGIEEGESIEQALEREMYEEVNLKVTKYSKLFEFVNDFSSKYNAPRMDHYYLITEFAGEIKLGDPELSRQSPNNIYRPEWVEIDKLAELNLMPEEAKGRLISHFEHSKILAERKN